LSLHDALPIWPEPPAPAALGRRTPARRQQPGDGTCVRAIRARWEDGWPSRRARSLDRGDVALMGVRLPSGALPHVSVSQLTPPARVSPSPPIAPGSGQGEEQLLHVLLVESRVGAGQALLEARGDDREAGPVQGLGHRGELGDDVPAVAALLDHAHHRAELSLGPLEAVDRGCRFAGVELHGELLEEVRGRLPLYPGGCVNRVPRALPAGCRAYPRGHIANTPLGMYVRGTPTSGRPDHQGGADASRTDL